MKSRIPFFWPAALLSCFISVAHSQTPQILAQPTNVTVLAGGAGAFSVTALGAGPLTYQWRFNGTNLPKPVISTVAGDGTQGYSGDGGAATNAAFGFPYGVAVDASGNLFIADYLNLRVRRVDTNGITTTVAGNGTPLGLGVLVNPGDGGAATNARLFDPAGVAVDAYGNLFIADSGHHRVRKVGTDGIISTVAGNGTPGYSGDGYAATNAQLWSPLGVAVGAFGNLFIADAGNNRIRKLGTNGIITTVAGNGTWGYSGDGSSATNAELNSPSGVAVDASGNLFIADADNNVIRELGTNGVITTVAGNWAYGVPGDGGAATSAALSLPLGVAVDASGNLFIADCGHNRVREVGSNGIINSVAGDGPGGYSGDGGPAVSAELWNPQGVAVDASGNLFIADTVNQRIREVVAQGPVLLLNSLAATNAGAYAVVVSNPYGSVTSSVATLEVLFLAAIVAQPQTQWLAVGSNATLSVAATGTAPLYYQWYYDGAPLEGRTNATLPLGAAGFTNAGSYEVVVTNVCSQVTSAVAVLNVGIPPAITTQPVSQTNLLNTTAAFSVAVSGTGPLTYQWQFNGTDLPSSVIPTLAGNGTQGYSGDGGAATNAELGSPYGVAVDASGNLFIADFENVRVRKVGTNGIITTVAGNGKVGYGGDRGAATSAEMFSVYDVAVDASGNLFIADAGNNSVRKVGTNGIITTAAGNGMQGYSGDGGAATNAEMFFPDGVAVDAAGNLFIADAGNHSVRKVGTNGIITTVAGNGTPGYSGDGGPATSAELSSIDGVAVDAFGNLFIAGAGNDRIRKVDTDGIISTAAGNGNYGYSGDGGAATKAELSNPTGVALDASGNLFIADQDNNVLREVGTNGIITTVAATAAGLSNPRGVAMDASGNLFIADTGNQRVRKVVLPGPTLVLNHVAGPTAGAYDVVVSSPYGSVTSSVVSLALALPPLNALPVGSQQVQLQFQGVPGMSYVLLSATDLSPPVDWRPVVTNVASANGRWAFTDTNLPSARARFYRMSSPGQ